MTFLEECPLCLLDKRIRGFRTGQILVVGGGMFWVSRNQCPVARFGVLTTALLKIKDVVGYYAGVLVNKVVIFRVTQSRKATLFYRANEGITTLREVRDYLKVSYLITSRYDVP